MRGRRYTDPTRRAIVRAAAEIVAAPRRPLSAWS